MPSKRHVALAAASCAALIAAAAPAATAQGTHGPRTLHSAAGAAGSYTTLVAAQRANKQGFTWLIGQPAGLPAGGVRVLIQGKHGPKLTAAVKYTVSLQHKYGVPIRFAGTTTKRKVKNAIVVYNFSGGHCRAATEAGYGGFRYFYDGSGRTVKWFGYAQICPPAYHNGILQDTVLHEMGHSVNLGHYRAKYHGKHQVMFPIVYSSVHAYRLGDIHGLRAVARHAF